MAEMKRWLANCGTLAVGLGASLLLAEGLLRLAGVHYPAFYTVDSQRGYALRPGAQGTWTREGQGRVRVNSAGFRGPEVSTTPDPGVLRIAVLGDSFTEGLQVDEPATWVQQLQALLMSERTCGLRRGHPAGVEVLNFGVGGYGTGQELLTWRHLARRYHPDLVLLALYPGNDFTDNEPQAHADRPVFRLDNKGRLQLDNSFRSSASYRSRTSWPGQLVDGLINHSRLLQLLNEAKNRWANRTPAPSQQPARQAAPSTPQASPQAWALTDALIGALAAETRAAGARFAVVSTSSPDQLWPRPEQRPAEPFAQEQRFAALLAARRIPYLPLAPQLQRQADLQRLTLHGFPGQAPGEGHWNATGHRLAAAAIAPLLCGL
jgi:hypothetical protein